MDKSIPLTTPQQSYIFTGMLTPIVKTNASILESYGYVKFDDYFEHNTVECQWAGGQWSRNGYGRTREEAAGTAMDGLKYLVHKVVWDVERETARNA